MSTEKLKEASKQIINVRLVGPITLWVIMFWGNPDIADAIIHHLMK